MKTTQRKSKEEITRDRIARGVKISSREAKNLIPRKPAATYAIKHVGDKVFLCSRNIQIGDEVKYDLLANEVYSDYRVTDIENEGGVRFLLMESMGGTSIAVYYPDLDSTVPLKIIGELSLHIHEGELQDEDVDLSAHISDSEGESHEIWGLSDAQFISNEPKLEGFKVEDKTIWIFGKPVGQKR